MRSDLWSDADLLEALTLISQGWTRKAVGQRLGGRSKNSVIGTLNRIQNEEVRGSAGDGTMQADQQGHESKEIAEMMGLSRCAVRTALTRGRRNGSLPPLKRTGNLKHMLRAANLRNGNIREVFDNITMEQTVWLVSQASEIGCQTVSEYHI
jgi:hypothetical protein